MHPWSMSRASDERSCTVVRAVEVASTYQLLYINMPDKVLLTLGSRKVADKRITRAVTTASLCIAGWAIFISRPSNAG